MIKRALYFFRRQDEEELSLALVERFPSIKFVDGQRWPTSVPPLAEGIHLCTDSYVYFWPSDLVPELPSLLLPPARQISGLLYQGPTAGSVLQFQRCREKGGELDMGQLAVAIEDPQSPLAKFFLQLIEFMRKRYACRLDCYSSTSGTMLNENLGGYLVGKSIQAAPQQSPRLRIAFGRDDYLVCRAND